MVVERNPAATMSSRLDLTVLDAAGRHTGKAPIRTASMMALSPSRRLSVPCASRRQVRMSKITWDKSGEFSTFPSQSRRIPGNLGVVIQQ